MRITGMKKRSMALVLAFTLILMLAATAVPALAAPADSPYCLWVGGTPVTAGNAADIPAAYPAERTGKAAYDSGSNTLTLTDYRCTDFSCDGLQGVIHYAGTDPLKIVLAGSSAVSAGGGSVTCGIFSTGPLEISGNGLLTATGADGAFEKSYGVLFAESLTIKSGTVCAAGGDTETFTDSDAVSCGLFCTHGSVQIDGGTVIARGGETNQKSGSLSAGIAADLIKIQGGTVRASGAAANASYGLKAMLNEEYLAALSRQAEGLEETELKVEALRHAEKVQREAIAATNKPELTMSNYYENYARPLAEAMIEYKLLYDGMIIFGNIQNGNLHTGWYGSNWFERRYVVKYLDKNGVYHEEYYTYTTCDLKGESLSRSDSQQTINGIHVVDYAPGVSGINVQKKKAVQTSTPRGSKEVFVNVVLADGSVVKKISCDRYNFEFDKDEKGRMYEGDDYYSAADYDRDVALRQSEKDAIPGYGITVGAAAASVEAASANATAVRGEVKNAIEGNGWTAADADPAGIGVSDDARALATPYQRIVFGLTPEAKEFTVDDIDAPTYTGSALTPAVTVRDSEDATLQLAAGTDYTVAYTNNVDATTSAQKAKATVTGLGAYYGCTVEKEFDIDPSPVTLTANSATATYNGSEMIVTGFTCLKGGQTLGGLTFAGVSASGSGTNADTYEVTFSGVTLGQTRDTTGNYVVTGTENGLLTVDPKPIAYAGETNISFTYNGKAQQKTFMLGGRELELGNDFTVVIKDGDDRTVPEMKNAGTYYETFTGKGNYSGEWSLTVTIGKADPTCTAPTGLTATYGQTLADVTLTNPSGNTAGEWAWVDEGTTSVGNVGSNTFKANFTPTDGTNYNSKTDVDVAVTVSADDRDLQQVIADTTTYCNSIQDDYPAIASELSAAIQTAQGVASNHPTQAQVDAAKEALTNAKALAQNKVAFTDYQETQKNTADSQALDTDTTVCKNLIAQAKADIAALTYNASNTLAQNKALVDAIIEQLIADLAAARALQDQYYTYSGAGQDYVKTSGKSAVFVIKSNQDDTATFGKFEKAAVDGTELTANTDYEIAQGSLILTLKPDSLENLAVGQHALTVTFTDGRSQTAFNVRNIDPTRFDDVAVESDSFSFTVEWQGGKKNSINYTLYKQDGSVYDHPFNKNTVSSTKWQYNAWFSGPAACYVIEDPISGYQIRYENVGVYAEVTDRLCNGGTIINYKLPSTGDTADLALWLAMVAVGGVILCAAAVSGKRKKESGKE